MRPLSRREAMLALAASLMAGCGLAACGPRSELGAQGGEVSLSASSQAAAASGIAALATTTATSASGIASSGGAAEPTVAHTAVTASSTTAGPATATTESASSASGAATVAATPSASAAVTTVYAYFTQGDQLVKEPRRVAATEPLRASLQALLAGPTEAGHYTQIPRGTQLLGADLAGGDATINLSSQAATVQGSPAIPLFLGQLVMTATQFPTVQRVTLQIAGRPVRSLGGEGAAVPEPLDQAAVQRLLQGS